MGLGALFSTPEVAQVAEVEEDTVDADEEEQARRQAFLSGIQTSSLGISEGEQVGRKTLLGG